MIQSLKGVKKRILINHDFDHDNFIIKNRNVYQYKAKVIYSLIFKSSFIKENLDNDLLSILKKNWSLLSY